MNALPPVRMLRRPAEVYDLATQGVSPKDPNLLKYVAIYGWFLHRFKHRVMS
jgi:hypothetical protein